METPNVIIKYLCIFVLVFAHTHLVHAQDDKPNLVQRYKSKLQDTTDKPGFLLYPTLAFAPETRWEIGAVGLILFYAKNDTRNRVSEANVFAFYTMEKQYGIWAEQSVYTDKDKWFLHGTIRYQFFPLLYYGVGHNTPDDPAIVNSDAFIFHQRALRLIGTNLFFGPIVDFYNLYNVDYRGSESFPTAPIGASPTGSFNIAVGASLTYNSRHNPLNSKQAKYLELAYMDYAQWLGSEYSFHNVFLDGRIYADGIKKNHVWASQVVANFNFGTVPFNMMSMTGGEMIMRGFYTGRHRDKHMVAAQTEYRILPFSFSKRFGAAAFASIGTVSPDLEGIVHKRLYPSGGLGLRYAIFKSKDVNVRFDVAFTHEGPAYYFFLGEAF